MCIYARDFILIYNENFFLEEVNIIENKKIWIMELDLAGPTIHIETPLNICIQCDAIRSEQFV